MYLNFLIPRLKKYFFCAILCSFCMLTFSFAQSNAASDVIKQGIKLHDKGDFDGAIQLYKTVLQTNSKLPQANYEIASSYFGLKDYENAIKHCNVVIEVNIMYTDQAYILKGSALDLMGKSVDAVKTYKEGISKFPDNYLLYYNLALTSFNLKKYNDVDEALMKALTINPAHASSHLLLGYSMSTQGHRVKSVLALSNFLLIEPTGKRAVSALDFLENEFAKGVKKEDDNSVSITVPIQKKSDAFGTAELMLSLLESSKQTEANKNKSSHESFAENLKSLFNILGELKKDNKGFWWNFYVDFFYTLSNKNHVEALSYYIMQAKNDNTVYTWLQQNKDKYEALADWYSNYKR